jgi:prepilin-type N-terminal cleavage/methylation domain-containing protein
MKKKFVQNGFTLLELLLAASIMSVALSGMLAMFVNSIALEEAARNMTVAASHVQFVLEDMKNSTFSTLATDIGDGDWNWDATEISGQGLTPLNTESISAQVSGSSLLEITVTAQDLEASLGHHAADVLARPRPLTLPMRRRFHRGLGILADILFQ